MPDVPVASDPDAVLEHIGPGADLIVPLANNEPVALLMSSTLMPSTRTETHLQVRGPARPGDVVTTFKNTVDKVVTEWAVADPCGRALRQRVETLIAIAHPAHRDRLRAAAVAV